MRSPRYAINSRKYVESRLAVYRKPPMAAKDELAVSSALQNGNLDKCRGSLS